MRSLGAAGLLVLVALAGCSGGSDDITDDDAVDAGPEPWDYPVVHAADGTVLADDAWNGTLPDFEQITVTDRISGEPTVAIDREGRVWYAAIDFDGPGDLPVTKYYRSADGGQTWQDKSPNIADAVNTHPYSFDPYVWGDPTTGRIYAMDMGPHVACNKVSWTDDGGETWITREGACIPGVNDHPTLFGGPATAQTNTAVYPNQMYLCTNQITDSICYQSPDGGLNWIATPPAFMGYDTENDQLCGGLHGHGHVSWTTGTFYLGRDWCGDTMVAISDDGAVTYDQVTIAGAGVYTPSEHDVSIAADEDGVAYAFWAADSGDQGGRGVFLSRSTDDGRTWSEPWNVTAPQVTAVKLPSLTAGASGRIAFQYVGTATPHGWAADDFEDCGGGDCPRKHPDEYLNMTWNVYVGMSLDAQAENPTFATTTVNDVDKPVKRGSCNGRCPGNSAQGGFYDFLDIESDPITGQVWSAIVDVCPNECDEPGADAETPYRSYGAVGKQVAGTYLRDEPISERTAGVAGR